MVLVITSYCSSCCSCVGNKTLSELRQLYFKMKEDIFAKSGFEIGYNTKALERILKHTLDDKMRMSDIKEPK